ncbi:YveK family protein [Lactiplantibacillus plantarum]|uniref:hypothetical protein n=1 Tax=Lactiplantibacillus plantarum TaxID=1590 RepID=UPI00293CC230|nr:hypothetical protein [Lactiplantibacillus plantarum]MDV3524450.1 hypothetical protein [Lactiplantibacillus plantarum]
MKTIWEYIRLTREHWELYLFSIIICLSISVLFINNNKYVYTSQVQVVSKNKKLAVSDTASMSVYQTMIKHPVTIISAQKGLKDDYGIYISQDDLVKSITTTPVLSGNSVQVIATNSDSQIAVAMGKQVAKSFYYALRANLPNKQSTIDSNPTLENTRSLALWYNVSVAITLGIAIGFSIQLYITKYSKKSRRGNS